MPLKFLPSAVISIVVTASTAGAHWLATNRRQISSYSRSWSPPKPAARIRSGVLFTSVGRIAS